MVVVMMMVRCCRARDKFTMEHKPSLEDVWTDRIFDAFTRKHKLATRRCSDHGYLT